MAARTGGEGTAESGRDREVGRAGVRSETGSRQDRQSVPDRRGDRRKCRPLECNLDKY